MIPVLLGGQKTLEAQIAALVNNIYEALTKMIVSISETDGSYVMDHTFSEILTGYYTKDVIFETAAGVRTKFANIDTTGLTITLPETTFTAATEDDYPSYTPEGG